MKRIIFLIIATLLVIGLVLPGCAEEPAGPVTYTFEDAKIKIAIAGPMEYIQGEHMLAGAELAAAEINVGGVNIAGHTHTIEILEVETKEISQPYPGYSAAQIENAITVQGADFIMGGFRTEATGPMIETAMDEETMFFIAGSATASLLEQVNNNYNKYKYLFRATPINEVFLFVNCIIMLGMIGNGVMTALNTTDTTDVNVAFLAEDLLWTQGPLDSVEDAVVGLNHTLVGTWKVSDTADDLTTELNEIADADTHIIFTFLSGPVGLTYGLQMGELEVPAMTVGINVESQDPGFWDATEYDPGKFGAEGMITLATWAPNIAQSGNVTTAFLDEFETETGDFPIYTAATYDMVYGLVEALEDEATWDSEAGVGSVLADDVIGWLENPANERTITSGTIGYYVKDATNDYLIGLGVPCYAHDLKYGPAYATGIGVQWRDDDLDDVGETLGVWPKKEFAAYATALCPFNAALSLNWTGFEWPGTTFYSIPTWMVVEWLTP